MDHHITVYQFDTRSKPFILIDAEYVISQRLVYSTLTYLIKSLSVPCLEVHGSLVGFLSEIHLTVKFPFATYKYILSFCLYAVHTIVTIIIFSFCTEHLTALLTVVSID